MEAVGIRVKICDDAAYSNVEGFVLGGPSQAIIANWVRGEGIWHVDTARRASILADFREAAGFANAHSIVEARSPQGDCALRPAIWSWTGHGCNVAVASSREWVPPTCYVPVVATFPQPASTSRVHSSGQPESSRA